MPQSFQDLHARGNPFNLANAWDIVTARLFAGLGAHAFSLGRSNLGNLTRDEALAHAQDIVVCYVLARIR